MYIEVLTSTCFSDYCRFVEFATVREAEKALTELDHFNIGCGEYLKVRIKSNNQNKAPANEPDVLHKVASGCMSASKIGHTHDDQSIVQGRSAPWMSQNDGTSQMRRSKSVGSLSTQKAVEDDENVVSDCHHPPSWSSQSQQNEEGVQRQSRSPYASMKSGMNTSCKPESETYTSLQSPTPVNGFATPPSPYSMAPNSEQKVTKLCTHCGKVSTKRCLACKAPYCSKECQQADWPEHSKMCGFSKEHADSVPAQPSTSVAKSFEQTIVVDPKVFATSNDFDISLGHLESPLSSPLHEGSPSHPSSDPTSLGQRPPSRPSSDQTSPGRQGLGPQCNGTHGHEPIELVSIQNLPNKYQLRYIPCKQVKCTFFLAEVLCKEKMTITATLKAADAEGTLVPFYPTSLHERSKVVVRVNGEVRRAEVETIKGNSISAKLMDLGQFVEVTIGDVFMMPNDIRLIPAIVQRYALYGIKSVQCKQPEDAQAFLESHIKDKVLTVKVMGRNNFGQLAQLYDPLGVCINDVLCESEFFAAMDSLTRQHSNTQRPVSWTKDLQVHRPPVSEPFEIIPTVVYNPTHIWAQVNHEHLQILAQLIHDMTLHYAQSSSTGLVPLRGELCAAVSPKDNCWYRADVLNVDNASQMCGVRFIDYGDKENVSLNKIRRLDDVFRTYPRQSLHFQMANVESSDDSGIWSEKVTDAISAKLTDRPVKVQVLAYNEPFNFFIKMHDPDDPVNILNDSLVKIGAAKYVPLPHGVIVPSPVLPVAGFGRAATILKIAKRSQPGSQPAIATGATPPLLAKGHGQTVGNLHSTCNPQTMPPSPQRQPRSSQQPQRPVGLGFTTLGDERRSADYQQKLSSGFSSRGPMPAAPENNEDQSTRPMKASLNNLPGGPVGTHYPPPPPSSQEFLAPNTAEQKSAPSNPPQPVIPPIGQNFEAFVTHVESVELFYLQVAKQDTIATLSEMSTRASQESPLTNVSVGTYCMAIFEEVYYRAKVIEMISAKEAVVQFIDFGNSETISTDKLRLCDLQSALAPAMAIPCALASAPRLRKGANEFFTELVVNQKVLAVVRGNGNNNVTDVMLSLNDGRKISSLLVQQGFVVSSSEQKPPPQQMPPTPPHFVSSQLPKSTLANGAQVMVSHVENPFSLWLQLGVQKTLDALNTLQQMLLSPAEMQPPGTVPSLGSLCVAKFSEDDCWYRALVLEELDSQQIRVRFIDYGNSSIVALSDTRPFVKELLTITPQTVECSLTGIEPICGETWSSDAVSLLLKHTQDAMLIVNSVEQVEGNKYIVSLVDGQGKSLSDYLFTAKLAVKADASRLPPSLPSPASKKQPAQLPHSQHSRLMQQNAELFMHSSSSGPVLVPPQETPASTTSKQQQTSPLSMPRNSPPAPPVHFTTPMKLKVTFQQLAPPKSRFKALVMCVNSPSSIWFQILDSTSQEALIALYSKLSSCANSSPPVSLRWSPGDHCAVLNSEDNTWYRAKVLATVTSSTVSVRLVDFGLEQVAGVANMRLLTDEFVQLPAQAVHAKLADTMPIDGSQNWSQPAIQSLQDLILEKQVSVEVVSHEEGMLVVEMYDSSPNKVSVSQTLKESAQAKSAVTPKQHPTTPVYEPSVSIVPTQVLRQSAAIVRHHPNPSLQKQRVRACDCNWVMVPAAGETFSAMVSHVASVGKFWMQVANKENVSSLMELMDQVNQHASSSKAQPFTSPPENGELCLAKFSEDQMWYRASVLDASPAATTVQFVDFGNVDTLSPTSICHIPSQFLSLPFQALCGSLAGLPEHECSSPSMHLTARFSQLVDGKCLSCEVVSEDPLFVNLMDAGEESGVTVRDSLVRMKMLPFMEDSSIPKVDIAEIHQSEQCTCIISHDRGPSDFYLQVISQEAVHNFSQMMSQISDYCSRSPQGTQEALLGQIVCAKFYEDQSWNRSRVIGFVDNNNAHIQFIDFGNTDIVPVGTLIPMHSDFTHIPAQAIHCCLKGFEGKQQASNEVIDKFQQLTSGKALVIEMYGVICDENGSKRCTVELADVSSKDVKISSQL